MADHIDQLRRTLAALTGPVRTRTLCDLARVLSDRYWRAGPGNAGGRPDLDEAIGLLDEAYGYFQPGDGLRGTVAAQLGFLLTARFTAHDGAVSDRETGIERLLEALESPRVSPPMMAGVHTMLGQLYLSRCSRAMQQGGMTLAMGRGPAEHVDAARRAAGHFRQALTGPQLTADMTTALEAMLAMAEGMEKTLGGQDGLDFSGMIEAMRTLQRIQKQGAGPGMGSIFTMGQRVADLDPLDRPVSIFDGPEPPPRTTPPKPRTIPETAAPQAAAAREAAAREAAAREAAGAETADAEVSRKAFRERLGADDPYAALAALLVAGVDVDTADELMALAVTTVHSGRAGPADHLFLAAALLLRGRATGGPEARDDEADALVSLRAAVAGADELPEEALPVLLRAGALLGEAVDAPVFARLSAALRSVGADALACPQPGGFLLLHGSSGRVGTGTERTLPRRTLIAADRPPTAGVSIVSTVAGHRQLLALATRKRPRVAENPVFAGDGPEIELFRACYAAGERTDADRAHQRAATHATPRSATMLHFAAAPAVVSTPGLVILPPGEGLTTLADAFIRAGCTGVVGWLRPVPARPATIAYLALHHRMGRERMEPAAAVHSVRRWLRSAQRSPLPGLPDDYAAEPSLRDLAASFVHRGI